MQFWLHHNLQKNVVRMQSYKGSKWDRNIFPQDTIDLLEQERGVAIEVTTWR